MNPEFSRAVAVETIGTAPCALSLKADSAELEALAARFDLVAVDALTADAVLVAAAVGIEASGRLHASVVQRCVVTGDPVVATIDQLFALRFVHPSMFESSAEEVELSNADCDVVAHDGATLDLGEAVAQTLALALDPFPRATVGGEAQRWTVGEEAHAFAGLKQLLEKR